MINIQELVEVRRTAALNLDSAGGMAMAIPPVEGGESGVIGALRRLAVETARAADVSCDFVRLGSCEGISALSSLGLYRVAAEWLREVVEHLHARRVSITLSRRDGVVELCIRDEAPRPRGRLTDKIEIARIEGMARAVGGGLAVTTKIGGGTKLKLRVPCGTCDDVVNFQAA